MTTPNGSTLPFKMKNGVKEFHLIAEPVKREFAPGMVVNCWGYNGQTPGPTIEAVEGDRVRILVTNRLPEHTTVHWHGIFLPAGMDGVGGLTQPHIKPGETYAYEFTLKQHGTHMYHPHADEVVQMALGMMGFFVIHPRRPDPDRPRVDRDFCIFPHMWFIEPGTMTPNPNVMLDFNLFTFNSRAFPGTDPLVARLGDRVRIRLGNVGMTSHPIHIHGVRVWVVETDGGPDPALRVVAGDHGQRHAGDDPGLRVRGRRARRLAAALPQGPSRHERHGPRHPERHRRRPGASCSRSSTRSPRERWRWARTAWPSTRRTPSTRRACPTPCP